MNLTHFILLPFSILYGLVMDIRNFLYNKGFWREYYFHRPIINVGNLTVGGTGKTPHVEYLVQLLKDKYLLITLSRGYGRKTKGYFLADSSSNAQTIGDEPYQFYRKFKDEIKVAVGEKRVEAISEILNQHVGNELIILDDAFQHRAIKPSLNLLLMDFSRPIYRDFTFPAGRLRERRHGAKRADGVIITKCPEGLPTGEQRKIAQNLQPYLQQNIPIFFTKIKYGKPQNCRSDKENLDFDKVILLSGIANPKSFETFAETKYEVVQHLIFKDHHDYSEKDFKEIRNKIKFDCTIILMTEKDMVKFQPFLGHELLKEFKLYYLPIETDFLEVEMKANFDELILSHASLYAQYGSNREA
jgi:tetraacyldisaccharide 4'-kinase